MSDPEVLVQRVEHGQDGGGHGRGVRLDGGAREGARLAVDAGHEEGRVGRAAGHQHVVATGEESCMSVHASLIYSSVFHVRLLRF